MSKKEQIIEILENITGDPEEAQYYLSKAGDLLRELYKENCDLKKQLCKGFEKRKPLDPFQNIRIEDDIDEKYKRFLANNE